MMQQVIALIICCTLLSCAQKKETSSNTSPYPPENFSVINEKRNGKVPILGIVNMSYSEYDRKSDYPYCIKLDIELNKDSLFETALPKKSESDIANKVEDDILEQLTKVGTTHYIGHLYGDKTWTAYFYVAKPEKAEKLLEYITKTGAQPRTFKYQLINDPKWGQATNLMH